jgi:general secretion pathway protein L
MSTLVVLIPPRRRFAERDPAAPVRAGGDYAWVRSSDGLTISHEGRSPASLLPKADSVVAVLTDADVAWHRLPLPKAPAAKLRAALIGVLEDSLLDDPDTVHLATAPNPVGGQPTWIAAVHKPWLKAELAALERARVFVDRVVPSAWPDEPATGHFSEAQEGGASTGDIALTWAHAGGVVTMRLKGTLARALLPPNAPTSARFSATPAVAAPAERWLGAPVTVMSPGARALLASRSLWNLRQFDLAASARGTRALADVWRRLRSPTWRPARIGVIALLAVHLVGLNAWAWRQSAAIDAKREQAVALLRSTFPQVRAVLDAPAQMQREVDAVRAAAGRPGETDLEPLLAAAAAAWPDGRGAIDTMRFAPGRLTLSAAGWSAEQINQFRAALQRSGWQVEAQDGRLVVSRASGGGTT